MQTQTYPHFIFALFFLSIQFKNQFTTHTHNVKEKNKKKQESMIMDDHKWGFALEEAVKEVESEIHKQENKHKKQQKQRERQQHKKNKWGIVGRIFIRSSARGKSKNSEDKQGEKDEKHQNKDQQITINDNQNDQATTITATTTSTTATTTTLDNNNDTSTLSSSLSGKDGMSQLTTPDSPIVDLKRSCNSPIMSGNYPNGRRRTTPRKTGVAERNETERKVVYKTLKNYNQINKLHDYDLV